MNNTLHTAALTVAFTLAVAVNLTTANNALSSPLTTDAIVDFDDAGASPSDTSVQIGSPFTEDGVTLTATDPVDSFLVITENNAFTTGSPLLFSLEADTEFTISAEDADFGVSLLSLDVADLIDPSGATLEFVGTRFDGTTVIESVTTDGGSDFIDANDSVPETFNLSLLANEVFESISFVNPGSGVGIDNIAVRLTLVPEPSSLALLGLASLSAARIRRRIA